MQVSASKYFRLFRHEWPSVMVLVLGAVFAGYVSSTYRANQLQLHAAEDEARALEYAYALRKWADSCVLLNGHIAAFFSASEEVSPQEFEAYISASAPFVKMKELSFVGYLPRVASHLSKQFEWEMRKFFPAYRIVSDDPQEFHYPVLYQVQVANPERTELLRGLDYAAIPERRDAMNFAVKQGRSIATTPHPAVKDPQGRLVVLIFTPVYHAGRPTLTVDERQAALKGFVVSSFFVAEMLKQAMDGRFDAFFHLEIYDGEVHSSRLVFDTDGQRHSLPEGQVKPLVYKATVDFSGRNWLLFFFSKSKDIQSGQTTSWLILVTGILLSVALALVTWLLRHRARIRRLHLEQANRFAHFFENHPFAVYSLDLKRRFINANEKALEEFGLTREELLGTSVEDFIVPENQAMAKEQFSEVLKGNAVAYENVVVNRHSERSDMSIVLIPVTLGNTITSVTGIAQNITKRKKMEQELFRQAHYDSLTGLPNRAFFYGQLDQAIKRSARAGSRLALLYFDIDCFKLINDQYGHDVGDEVIRTFAERVRSVLREVDFVCRHGGDEFIFILEDGGCSHAPEIVANKLLEAMHPKFVVSGHSLSVSTSIGIAKHRTGMDVDQLVRAADQAMYRAKQAGRNCYCT